MLEDEGHGDRRESLLFWLLVVFVVGFYWCPSSRALRSAPHDYIFYLGLLPACLVLIPGALLRGPIRSKLLAVSLVFVAYLGTSALWTRGDAELSLAQVGLFTIATAIFVSGASQLLSHTRWQQLTGAVVVAASSVAALSVVAFFLGHQRWTGRLNSIIHYEHPNLFAHYLGFAALLCLLRARTSHLGWTVAGGFLTISVVLTGGRAALLALILAATVTVILGRDRRIAALFAVLVMAILVVGLGAAGSAAKTLLNRGDAGRDVIYQTLTERVADHPWIGLGLAAKDEVLFPKGSWEFPLGFTMPHPHSAFVATYYYGGMLGLSLLLVVLATAAWQAWSINRDRGDPTGITLLIFGIVCLLPDGQRLVSNPHLSSWLILWLPIAWIVAAGRQQQPPTETTIEEPPPSLERGALNRRIFWLLVVVFIAQRLFHLGPAIDTPQMWRQCDTAHFIRAFYEQGIDLLHPSVCWLGDHKTTILEFPLAEAVAAVAYHGFGAHHTVARVVFLLFFLGSAFYLFRFLREIIKEPVARLATLVYLIMPLSLFYSRALHIDFSALFLVHAMTYYFARGLHLESVRLMWVGSFFAALAMVSKAPYVLPMTLPLAVLVIRDRKWRFVLRSLPTLILPALLFGLWELHVQRVNSLAPDWFFIPHYRKMVQNGAWYFGTMAQRLDLMNWLRLGERFWREILGTLGLVPAIVGGLVMLRRRHYPVLAWCAGTVLMLLIFFNLSRLHNYYQTPFLAPLACLISVGILWLADALCQRRARSVLLTTTLLLGLAFEHLWYAETHYYNVLNGMIEGGKTIGESTPEGSLVIVSSGKFDCRSPHLLYHAGRYGWSITRSDIEPELVGKLVELGAEHLAIIDIQPPQGAMGAWLGSIEPTVVALESTKAKVFIYRLESSQ